MKRRFLLSSILVILAAALPAPSEVIDRIVAVIDDTSIITQSDIRKERAIQTALGENPGNDESLTETLIEKHLIEDQIALFREIDIDESTVTERLRGVQTPDGLSTEDLRDAVRGELRRYEFVIQRFRPFIKVSDEELRSYFTNVAIPALQKNGQPIPTVEQGMLDVTPNVLAEKMNKEVDDWLADLRRRISVEKVLQ